MTEHCFHRYTELVNETAETYLDGRHGAPTTHRHLRTGLTYRVVLCTDCDALLTEIISNERTADGR